ncbi:uncharacterized protein BCR38DRAFT_426472 [Pseudomassariella vexata]|uniref:Uncharacterized protein n=1 Tax=Pseudomassariella vexata TaxID=1141098 RepID=A0A1Y2E6T2_9PEZI|nr:uncharacterized protein BCR38DRAFT_426472 [Pseudomassariella vexata]ORY67242.1 hypothetical protein BCR38DRAFT_426472 [Pseudomassariella vexata]
MAMMTVDNGFENQWWYQGSREPITWWPRDQEEPSRLSMSDAMLLSAAEPPPISEQPIVGFHDASYDSTFSGGSPTLGIVSPMSTLSASPNIPLQRTLTTRSEELFLGT